MPPSPNAVHPGICNQYLYPRFRSMTFAPSYLQGVMQKAWIFSIKQSTQTVISNTFVNVTKTVDTTFAKQFQMNPPSLAVSLQSINTNSQSTIQAGGNSNAKGPGIASTNFEMYFDRQQEVALSARFTKPVNSFGVPWKDIGVAKDVYDVFSVILGADNFSTFVNDNSGVLNVTTQDQTTSSFTDTVTQQQSMTQFTGALFDLAGAGTQFLYQPIALAYNANLVVYGQVTSFNFIFTKFNSNLVPVTAKIDISIDIFNITNNNVPDTAFSGGAGTTVGVVGTTASGGIPASTSTASSTDAPGFARVSTGGGKFVL